MYKVTTASRVFQVVDTYGSLYCDAFLRRFTDTGLGFAETIIQNQYLESSNVLVHTIVDGIYSCISRDIIPYSPLENGMRETSFRIGNRRIFLTYEEDSETQTRYVVDIEILRK